MIKLLVKLSNLLDEYGKYKMAEEIDTLINKFAAETTQLVQDDSIWYLAQGRDKSPIGPYSIDQIRRGFDSGLINGWNRVLGRRRGTNLENNKWMSIKDVPEFDYFTKSSHGGQSVPATEGIYDSNPTQEQSTEETAPLQYSGGENSSNQINEHTQEIRNTTLKEMTQAEQAAWEKAGEPVGEEYNNWKIQYDRRMRSRQKNPLVLQIQKNLGLNETGVWDSKTNTAFIAAMTSIPIYAKTIVNGKFIGTLQQAATYIQQVKNYHQENNEENEDVPNPLKSAPTTNVQYKSRYDLNDVFSEITRLINKGKFSKEDIENLIGSATIQADKSRGNHQEAFEKIFKQLGQRSVR